MEVYMKKAKKIISILFSCCILLSSINVNAQTPKNDIIKTTHEVKCIEQKATIFSTTGKSIIIHHKYSAGNIHCFTLTQYVTFSYGNEDGNARLISYSSEITYSNPDVNVTTGNIITKTVTKTGNPCEYTCYVPVYINGIFKSNFYCSTYCYNSGINTY